MTLQESNVWFGKEIPKSTQNRMKKIINAGDNSVIVRKLLSEPEKNGIKTDTLITLCVQVPPSGITTTGSGSTSGLTVENALCSDYTVIIGTPLAAAVHMNDPELVHALLEKGFHWKTESCTEIYHVEMSDRGTTPFHSPFCNIHRLQVTNPEYYLVLHNPRGDLIDLILEDMRKRQPEANENAKGNSTPVCFGKSFISIMRTSPYFFTDFLFRNRKDTMASIGDDALLLRYLSILETITRQNQKETSPIPLCFDLLNQKPVPHLAPPLDRCGLLYERTPGVLMEKCFYYYGIALLTGNYIFHQENRLVQGTPLSDRPSDMQEHFAMQLMEAMTERVGTYTYQPNTVNMMIEICRHSQHLKEYLITYLTPHIPTSANASLISPENGTSLFRKVMRDMGLDIHDIMQILWKQRSDSLPYSLSVFPYLISASDLMLFIAELSEDKVLWDGSSEEELSILHCLVTTEAPEKAVRVLLSSVDRMEYEPKKAALSLAKDIIKRNSPELLSLALEKGIIPADEAESLVPVAAEMDCTQIIPLLYAAT